MCSCCFRCYDNCTLGCWEQCFAPNEVDLQHVEGTLQTGDVAIFRASPEGRIPGLNSIAACPWDHTGLIYMNKGRAYVIDSGSFRYGPFSFRPLDFERSDEAEWSKTGSGPQMYLLEDLMKLQAHSMMTPPPLPDGTPRTPWCYERLAVRHLRSPLTDAQILKLDEAIRELRDRPYEQDKNQMSNAALDCCCDCCGMFANKGEALDSLFCSELTSALLMGAGVLSRTAQPSSEYVPSDFTRDHGNNCSAFFGCCWLSWCFGRCCGCGDLPRADIRGPIYGPEVLVTIPTPPPSSKSK